MIGGQELLRRERPASMGCPSAGDQETRIEEVT